MVQVTARGILDEAVDRERGASSVEYALLAVLIAGVLFAVVGFVGLDVRDLYASVNW